MCLHFGFVIFLAKGIIAKAARKILIKLTHIVNSDFEVEQIREINPFSLSIQNSREKRPASLFSQSITCFSTLLLLLLQLLLLLLLLLLFVFPIEFDSVLLPLFFGFVLKCYLCRDCFCHSGVTRIFYCQFFPHLFLSSTLFSILVYYSSFKKRKKERKKERK